MVSYNFNIQQTYDFNELKNNLRDCKNYHVRVGILPGNKNSRDDGQTNAQVGNFAEQMESGSRSNRIPRRSFLVDPLTVWEKDSIIVFLKENAVKIIEGLLIEKGVRKLLGKLGQRAKKIVDDAFDTGGFGWWEPLAESTIKEKGSDKILVDTSQLRKAISYLICKGI